MRTSVKISTQIRMYLASLRPCWKSCSRASWEVTALSANWKKRVLARAPSGMSSSVKIRVDYSQQKPDRPWSVHSLRIQADVANILSRASAAPRPSKR